jgi:predicted ATPase/DNA-binding CsgD family transcriptional regulator
MPPAPLTALVGREHDVAEISELIQREDVRLVTLTGPGGVGKTRLAQRVAELLAPEFAECVAFVPLAPVRDPAHLLFAVAAAIGVHALGERPVGPLIADALADRTALLVLDNLERLVAAGPEIARLLVDCPGINILATSREALRISGEQVCPVAPLALPGVNDDAAWPATGLAEAVQLFVLRARSAKRDFALTEANAGIVAAICRRLDGLPLAIELAAARMRHLPPAALLARLDQRLPLLVGGARDQPARLRAMRDAISWSYDLLDESEQTLFRRLAVFTGGFSLNAAEYVGRELEVGSREFADGSTPDSAFDLVASLVDKSLVKQEGGSEGEPRFGMLETIAEFGFEQLVDCDEEAATRWRHARFFLDLVERAWPAISSRVGHQSWMATLSAERDNLRTALSWLIECEDTGASLRLAGGLYWFWLVHGHLAEGRDWLKRALALPGRTGTSLDTQALALLTLATLTHFLGDDTAATPLAEEALALGRQAGSRYCVGMSLLLLGTILEDHGLYGDARPVFEEALAEFREAGSRANEGLALLHLAVVTWGKGDLSLAIELGEAALDVHRGVDDRWGIVVAAAHLGLIVGLAGDRPRAISLLQEGLVLGLEVGAQREVAMCLANAAALTAATDQESAARLFGAADAVRVDVGSDWNLPERDVYERTNSALRSTMGEIAFDEARAAGMAMPLDDAIALVKALAPAPAPAKEPVAVGIHQIDLLTEREQEVLRLVTRGCTNGAIAEDLFISPGTVRIHVSNIFAKLGVHKRSDAAAIARRHGLG